MFPGRDLIFSLGNVLETGFSSARGLLMRGCHEVGELNATEGLSEVTEGHQNHTVGLTPGTDVIGLLIPNLDCTSRD